MSHDAVTTQGSEARHWGLLGTVLWGACIALVFVILQTLVMLAYVTRGQANLGDEQVSSLIEAAESNGVVLSLATLLTAALCVPLVLGVAKLKRGSRLADSLALRGVPLGSLVRWLGITLLFIVASDALTLSLGRPVVPDFMTTTYASATPTWLIWVALVVGAPLFEEVFFRGFLFKGLESAIKPLGAIVVTAALWSCIHLQYDFYGIGTLFVTGLLLGTARSRTGSLVPSLAMHALANVVACGETALMVARAAV